MLLGETDFHTLKNEQRLLVDFQAFPSQFVKLVEESKSQAASASSPSPADNLSSVGMGGGAAAMHAVLNIVSSQEAIFSIVESNQFRELQHLSLHFSKFDLIQWPGLAENRNPLAKTRNSISNPIHISTGKGNDTAIKEYLAAKLADYTGQNHEANTKISILEQENARLMATGDDLREECSGLKMQLGHVSFFS